MSIFFSRDFKFKEIMCPCCKKIKPIDPKLIYLLQSLRNRIDRPIYISIGGGLRCKAYNKRIRGYKTSPHIDGKAVDIHAKNMGIIDLAVVAKEIGFSRIGLYRSFIHVDTLRPVPSASWHRTEDRKYVYFKTLEETINFIKNRFENK